MILALGFAAPLLLLGLLAAAVPFLLHLLSSVRAPEVRFPTLRFLRMSMERTARRRRIQHWLLLAVRATLLALLAIAVAEPFTQAVGGWLAGEQHAAVIIVDNSLSMSVRDAEQTTRLARAKQQVDLLLSGDDVPAVATVLPTNAEPVSGDLSGGAESLRQQASRIVPSAGRAPLAGLVDRALDILHRSPKPKKSIYIFSDMQEVSFKDLAGAKSLARQKNIHLLIVNAARRKPGNVGITDLAVRGRRIVNEVLSITATLVNSSPTDRKVGVSLRVDGRTVGPVVYKHLRAAGKPGAGGTVRFHTSYAKPGPAGGEVALIGADDLPDDDVRHFSVVIGGRIKALIVGGPADPADPPQLTPTWCLRASMEPWADGARPWSIVHHAIAAAELDRRRLVWPDVVFLSNVASFTPAQAAALVAFAVGGGSVVFLLGPDVQADNYNRQLAKLLPARLLPAAGQVGAEADALRVNRVDWKHPYFEGFYRSPADYPTVLVWRYFPLGQPAPGARALMRMTNGQILLASRRVGMGRAALCTTTGSPKWSNLAVTLGPPLWIRAGLQAPRHVRAAYAYAPLARVFLRPSLPALSEAAAAKATVSVALPPDENGQSETVSVPLRASQSGYEAEFRRTRRPGVYRWRVDSPEPPAGEAVPAGQFAVNPIGAESKLAAFAPEKLLQTMAGNGFDRAYVADTVADVHKAAEADAMPAEWWDRLAAVVILLLVAESILANIRRRRPGA